MLDGMSESPEATVDSEVVDLCRELLRMDTSNYGDDSGPGERKAAEYVATLLDEVGIESRLYESAPGRTSLVAHWGPSEGSRSSCTATSTSYRPPPRTGRSTRSPARSRTATCGAAARST